MNKLCLICKKELTFAMFRDITTFYRAKYCGKTCYLQAHKARVINSLCKHCNKTFQQRQQARLKQTCSDKCSYEIRKVYGTKYTTSQGYTAIKTHSESSDSMGYELEHRMLMEQELNRKLSTNEQVHHINGVKTDNRLDNLIVLTNAEHQRKHYSYDKLNNPQAIKHRIKTRWGY